MQVLRCMAVAVFVAGYNIMQGVFCPVGLRWQTIHDCAVCNAHRPNMMSFAG